MDLFEVSEESFEDLAEFNAYLCDGEVDVDDDLHVVSGLSQYSRDEFLDILRARSYELEDLGAITRISKEYRSNGELNEAGFYLHFHDSTEDDETGGVVLLYTNQRKTEEIEFTVKRMFKEENGLYYLHIGASLFQTVRQRVLQEEEYAEITEFVADRSENSDRPANIRPEFRRTINYYGDDGWQALREMEQNYGVRPRYLKFNIPNDAMFKISRDGVFSLNDGSLTTLFDYIEVCIEEALNIKRAFDGSDFEMTRATESLSIPTAEPAIIELRDGIEYSELNAIKARMDDEDYFIIDSFGQEGSLHFTSKVYDQQKGNKFRLKATDDTIRVFPQDEEGDLGSFLRFHEFVQNHIDPQAEAIPP